MGKTSFRIKEYNGQVDNYCPACGKFAFVKATDLFPVGSMPSIVVGQMQSANECFIVKMLCAECSAVSAALYVINHSVPNSHFIEFRFYIPEHSANTDLPEEIQTLSPRFKKIYEQSVLAKSKGLDELSGFGFRKALEFLVKDYLTQNAGSEDRREKIAKMRLNDAINEMGDDRLTKIMHGLREGGNDETHYLRKYDFSVDELEEFINIVIELLDTKIRHDKVERRIDEAMHRNS